jgi:hypothetical protein
MYCIITDNASNECATLNVDLARSVQHLTGIHFSRTPCLSHTANLTIWDFLTILGTEQVVSCDLWTDVVMLKEELTHWS